MSRFGLWLVAVMAALALAPAPAHAKWIKGETDRFIVYGQGGEAQIRNYVIKLATFDAVLRAYHPMIQERVAGTKLQVVLINGDLKRIRPGAQANWAGFYTTRPDGIFAFVETTGGPQSDFILFHEYAHHFMLENFPVAYPAWFVEGFAEYFMTAEITSRGVKIGGYNDGRAYQILTQTWISWDELFSKSTGETREGRIQSYYAQAWLLTHYMRADPERAKMLNVAVNGVSAGETPAQAFWKATGWDEKTLTKSLKAYTRLTAYIIPNPLKAPPNVTFTQLPASADDMFLDRFRIMLSSQSDPTFLEQVRKRAARHPGDRLAELTLARAEYAMGDLAAGDALIARRLAAEPGDYETIYDAGVGKIQAARREDARRQEHLRKARGYFNKAFSKNDSDYRVLYGFALTRMIEPEFPTQNDLNVLVLARDLAPSFTELSMYTGMALLARGQKEAAMRVLAPVANDPHGRTAAAFARALIEGKAKADLGAAAKAMDEAPEPEKPPG